MDKFAFAHIYAYVAEGAAHGVKENQITRLQVIAVYFFGCCSLLARPAGQNEAGRLLKNGTNEAAAIESTVGVGTAAFVRDAKKSHRIHD